MKPEFWEQIAQVHRAALEIEEGARAAFLTKACAGNEVMRRQVESLLVLEGDAETFMQSSALEALAEQLAVEQLSVGALKPGSKLGSYEILGPLGAGGMGEVYRAKDCKLNRDVALKILPSIFSNDADRMARFRREAQVLASLNHPNIGSIYGLEESNDLRVFVLELVEGLTLADRITRRAVPLEEALPIARQIADAMAYAHEKGVTHRDLKPGNIKITPEGNVKVLDFGLAKVLRGHETSDSNSSYSSTFTNLTTHEHLILGTPAYMSPEQAKGKQVDKRADIWAFGVVLYELLTGDHLFLRETVSDTLAAVLKEEPDWKRIPVRVQPLLRHCLEKDPNRRLRDIGDMHVLLESASVPGQTHLAWLGWGAAAVFFVILAAISLIYFREKPLISARVQFQISTSGRLQGEPFAVSPDGRHLAFAASGSDGIARLWIRDLDSLEVRVLSDSRPASLKPRGVVPPFFWSRDSRFIGFQSEGKLAKIEISGGPAQPLCDVQGTVVGGSWNRDGMIVFADNTRGLMQVSAAGGVAFPLTTIDSSRKEVVHALPSFLPDGRHFLYLRASSTPENSGVYVGSLYTKPEKQDSRRLLATTSGPVYVPASDSDLDSGQVLFLRQGTLMAQPFDARRLAVSGEVVPIAKQVGSYIDYGLFSASSNGVLAYRSGGGQDYQLTWLDQQGRVLGTVAEPGRYNSLALSPEGKRVAVSRTNPENTANWDVWLLDVGRNTSTRLTYDQVRAAFPVWSADGSRVIFDSIHEGEFNLYLKSASGEGDEQLLLKSTAEDKYATSWSRDGRFLLYTAENPETKSDLWVLSLQGDRKPRPFLRTNFNESSGQFSPDGHWVAYTSDESGSDEIYVREFSSGSAHGSWGAAGKWLISKSGGTDPRWRGDGKELFYVASDGKFMSVEISAKPLFEAGSPRPLFQLPPGSIGGDVTADGRRFLIGVPVAQNASFPVTVVLNWQASLKK